ncbi:MAG: cytochrome b/b6 domain-containing protein [Chromatocurvus sp.]
MKSLERKKSYSGLSILNHWITALLVVAMLTLGLSARNAPDPAEDYIMSIHIALGFFVLLFVFWRTAVRLREGFPGHPDADAVTRIGAWWMHRALLVVLVLLVVTGPLYLFTEGEGMDVFGWFTFYIPLESLAFIHEPAEEVHKLLAVYGLPLLLGVHILGAARHYLTGRKGNPVADL